MERPSHLGLRHLALNVRDVARMKAFYVEVMGFGVEWEPDPDNVYLSSGSDNLALHRVAEPAPAGVGALDHLGVIVAGPDQVDVWAEFVESRGVALDRGPTAHRDGSRSCYFRDPEGNRVQVIHHPPISGAR